MNNFLCFPNQSIITEPLPGLLHDELPGIFLCSKPLLYEGDDDGSQPSVLADVPALTEIPEILYLSSNNKIQHRLGVSEGPSSVL